MQKLMIALASIVVFAAVPTSAWAFKCDSGRPGTPSTCSCSGRTDCQDMRKSEMCKGSLDCGSGKCSCTAALVVDPGTGTGTNVTGGVKPNVGSGVLRRN